MWLVIIVVAFNTTTQERFVITGVAFNTATQEWLRD